MNGLHIATPCFCHGVALLSIGSVLRRKLESAAYQLDSLVGEAVGAMGKFVDGALEAAAGKVPLPLMAEVKNVLKGVEDEAMKELSPLGEVGTLSWKRGT